MIIPLKKSILIESISLKKKFELVLKVFKNFDDLLKLKIISPEKFALKTTVAISPLPEFPLFNVIAETCNFPVLLANNFLLLDKFGTKALEISESKKIPGIIFSTSIFLKSKSIKISKKNHLYLIL